MNTGKMITLRRTPVGAKAWGVTAGATSCLLLLAHHQPTAAGQVALALGTITAAYVTGHYALRAALVAARAQRG
ncbi:hypothetical protein ACIA8K_06965 [Catenuloplanes sp. NPDC051500]|uniref:hypothetical protein n=1 Tax=Catenuloplanes sp. NPDC051500 TaxID=3363959 RepID=UPI00378F616F